MRTGELESIRLRRRFVVPLAVVAERLGITVPEVWLALGQGDVVSVAVDLHHRTVSDVLTKDIADDVRRNDFAALDGVVGRSSSCCVKNSSA